LIDEGDFLEIAFDNTIATNRSDVEKNLLSLSEKKILSLNVLLVIIVIIIPHLW
jgi:hypothetical protein